MKKILLSILSLVFISTSAFAACTKVGNIRTCYDPKTGNSSSTTVIGNSSYTNSYNMNTGTTWSSTTNRYGNMSSTYGNSSKGANWNSTSTPYGTSIYGTTSNGDVYSVYCDSYGNCN